MHAPSPVETEQPVDTSPSSGSVQIVAGSVDAGVGAGQSVPVVVGEPLGEEPSALMGTPVGEVAGSGTAGAVPVTVGRELSIPPPAAEAHLPRVLL